MALVDYTAATAVVPTPPISEPNQIPVYPVAPCVIGFPVANAAPDQGTKKDFWIKIALDFSLLNLAAVDWAKIFTIPARMFIFDVMTVIKTVESAGSGITIGDANADSTTTWVATQTGQTKDVVHLTLVADANGATRGKFYSAAGALYLSGTGALTTLAIDVYVHAMMLD